MNTNSQISSSTISTFLSFYPTFLQSTPLPLSILQPYIAYVSNPMISRLSDHESKQCLVDNKLYVFNKENVETINGLCEIVKTNEMEIVEYYMLCNDSENMSIDDLSSRIIKLYFMNRLNVCFSIRQLIEIYVSENSVLINNNMFVYELIKNNFINNLINRLSIIMNYCKTSNAYQDNWLNELWELILTIFYLSKKIQFYKDEVINLIKVIIEFSNLLHIPSVSQNNSLTPNSISKIKRITYALLFCLQQCIDINYTQFIDPRNENHDGINILKNDTTIINSINSLTGVIAEEDANSLISYKGVDAVFSLIWSSFLYASQSQNGESVDQLFRRVVSFNSFSYILTDWLETDLIKSESKSVKIDFTRVLSSLLLNSVLLQESAFNYMRRRNNADPFVELGYEPSDSDYNYSWFGNHSNGECDSNNIANIENPMVSLTRCFTRIFEVLPISEITPLVEEEGPFNQFLPYLEGEISFQSTFFPYFVSLMRAFICSESTAKYSYDLILRSRNINWFHQIIGTLERARDLFADIQLQGKIQVIDARILSCVLQLIQSTASQNIEEKPRLYTTYIGVLFDLLACKYFPTYLKASILQTIGSLSNQEFVSDIWRRINEAQFLTVPDQKGEEMATASTGLTGLHYDLEEVERHQQRFPLTIAFVKVILRLVELGGTVDGTISNYVDFILYNVFLILDDLTFSEQGDGEERWILTAICLQLFATLLSKCNIDKNPEKIPLSLITTFNSAKVYRSTNPSIELLKCFTFQQEFKDKLCSIIFRSYSSVFSNNKLALLAQQYSLYYALELTLLTIEKEELFSELIRTPFRQSESPVLVTIAGLWTKNSTLSVSTSDPLSKFLLRSAPATLAVVLSLGDAKNCDYSLNTILSMKSISSKLFLFLSKSDSVSLVNHLFQNKRIPELTTVISSSFADLGDDAIEEERVDLFSSLVNISLAPKRNVNLSGIELSRWERLALLLLEVLHLNLDSDIPPRSNLAFLLLNLSNEDNNGCASIIENLLSMCLRENFVTQYRVLAESCFHLFFKLLKNPYSAGLFLQIIDKISRKLFQDSENIDLTPTYFCKVIESLPHVDTIIQSKCGDWRIDLPTYFRQRAWLMECLAIQCHILIQRSKSSVFSSKLVDKQILNYILKYLDILPDYSRFGGQKPNFLNISLDSEKPGNRCIELLEVMQSNNLSAFMLQSRDRLPDTFNNCLVLSDKSGFFSEYNINELMQILDSKQEESTAIIKQALEWNTFINMFRSIYTNFDAWVSLNLVSIIAGLRECKNNKIEMEHLEHVLFNIMLNLLERIQNKNGIWMKLLSEKICSTILTFMEHIKTNYSTSNNLYRFSKCQPVMQLIISSLESAPNFQSRVSLYSFLYLYNEYLENINKFDSLNCEVKENTMELSIVHGTKLPEKRLMVLNNNSLSDVLLSNASFLKTRIKSILDTICNDIAEDNYSLRINALICLTSLIRSDKLQIVRTSLTRDKLERLIETFKSCDLRILSCLNLEKSSELASILFCQSFLYLFNTLAHTKDGAELLLNAKLPSILASFKFLNFRPDSNYITEFSYSSETSPYYMFHELLLPFISLLNSLMSSNFQNQLLHNSVFAFLTSHQVMISHVLRELALDHIEGIALPRIILSIGREILTLLLNVCKGPRANDVLYNVSIVQGGNMTENIDIEHSENLRGNIFTKYKPILMKILYNMTHESLFELTPLNSYVESEVELDCDFPDELARLCTSIMYLQYTYDDVKTLFYQSLALPQAASRSEFKLPVSVINSEFRNAGVLVSTILKFIQHVNENLRIYDNSISFKENLSTLSDEKLYLFAVDNDFCSASEVNPEADLVKYRIDLRINHSKNMLYTDLTIVEQSFFMIMQHYISVMKMMKSKDMIGSSQYKQFVSQVRDYVEPLSVKNIPTLLNSLQSCSAIKKSTLSYLQAILSCFSEARKEYEVDFS